MVAWIKRTWAKLFGGGAAVVARPVGQKVCPTCGAMMPADPVDTFDYENWKPEAAPPDKIEQGDEKLDHVFAVETYYHVVSGKAGAFDQYPQGEGDARNFIILRSSRKLPPQFDENGRCRQLDLEGLEEHAEKAFVALEDGETPLDNVFDADKLSDEEFAGLWLEGNEKDEGYWSNKPALGFGLSAVGEETPPALRPGSEPSAAYRLPPTELVP